MENLLNGVSTFLDNFNITLKDVSDYDGLTSRLLLNSSCCKDIKVNRKISYFIMKCCNIYLLYLYLQWIDGRRLVAGLPIRTAYRRFKSYPIHQKGMIE